MGLPTVSDNLNGYEQGQLLNKVDNIKSNSYYLIHGTLDDNVHYQQSLLLAKVLEQKDILFRQQVSLFFFFWSNKKAVREISFLSCNFGNSFAKLK